jgi:hypothetical protein
MKVSQRQTITLRVALACYFKNKPNRIHGFHQKMLKVLDDPISDVGASKSLYNLAIYVS